MLCIRRSRGAAAQTSGGVASVSVFIGGGTPSLFSPESIDALLSGVRARLRAGARRRDHAGSESRHGRGGALPRLSRPRASTGSRSASRASTTACSRRSAASIRREEARRAIDAGAASFDNVNLDLMYGLPSQTAAMARADLDAGRRAPASRTFPPTSSPSSRIPSSSAGRRRCRRTIESRGHAGRSPKTLLARRGLRALRDLGVRAARTPLPAQSQLLGVRRLPRHRRRRARQAQLSRPRHAACRAPSSRPST